MAVLVDNIYYLLCYAYGHADDLALAPSGQEVGGRVENLFAHVLSATTERLIKRGLARRYQERQEDLRGLRGKVQLGNTISRALLRSGQLSCTFEELSHDLLENQILKSAASWLSHHPAVSEAYRLRLARITRLLTDVADAPLASLDFRGLGVHPPRLDYSLGLAVARLLAEGALPRPDGASGRFVPFEADPAKMGALFEDFVRGFITVEHPDHRLLSRWTQWQAQATEQDLRLLPHIARDVPVILNGKRLIIECKFYKDSLLENQFGGQKLRSAHLYQLFAYLMNDLLEAEGLLLYAAAGTQVKATFDLSGRRIRVRTLDLNQPWPKVHSDLMGILCE